MPIRSRRRPSRRRRHVIRRARRRPARRPRGSAGWRPTARASPSQRRCVWVPASRPEPARIDTRNVTSRLSSSGWPRGSRRIGTCAPALRLYITEINDTFANVTARSVSFRDTLKGAISDFLDDERMPCSATCNALIETSIALVSYREEGVSLFPQVFICDDAAQMVRALGADHIELGRGSKDTATVRMALKRCAPLARGGWAIYVERCADKFAYGIFRARGGPLAETPLEILSCMQDIEFRAICAYRVAETVVAVVGAGGSRLHLHPSDHRAEEPVSADALDHLVDWATVMVAEPVRVQARAFLRRTFQRCVQTCHGMLVAVVESGDVPELPPFLAGGVRIEPALDIAARVRDYVVEATHESTSALQGLVSLLEGLACSDGIVVLSEDAKIVAYRVFVTMPASTEVDSIEGGARSRAYLSLCEQLGDHLRAAFFLSQDGRMLFKQTAATQVVSIERQTDPIEELHAVPAEEVV